MNAEQVKGILTRYILSLDASVEKMAKVRDSVSKDFTDGAEIGDMVIDLHRAEKRIAEEAILWLDTVTITEAQNI